MEANTRKVNKDTKLFLAPLAGYTDSAFRTITFKMGVDIAYSEMISAKAMCYKDKKTLEMLNISPEGFTLDITIQYIGAIISKTPTTKTI